MKIDDPRQANHDSIRAWNANAAYWDEYMGEGNDWHLGLVRPAVDRLLGVQAGQRVLDVGCGNGLYARHLASLGAHVLGVDAAEAMVERARGHRTDHDDRIEYRVVDCTDEAALRALDEGPFDAAVANMMLMDIPDVAPLFRALAGLLHSGAPFVVAIPHPAFNHPRVVHLAERTEADGHVGTKNWLKIADYLEAETSSSRALRGQPAAQPHFHRPLSVLLRPAFEAGLVLDALDEPAFPPDSGGRYGDLPGIPPVLVMRLRTP